MTRQLSRLVTVFAILCGVLSPAVCTTLCSLGIGCAPLAPQVSPEDNPKKCPNCPDPEPATEQAVEKKADGACCCAWIAEKVDPPATSASLAPMPLPAIALAEPISGLRTWSCPAERTANLGSDDRAPPGPPVSSYDTRAPPRSK